ncbi:hypothetical protein BS78_01G060200 [Paspalum vaginatum]|nr:hypothetical protein BS78_01G060200 [Paspalum vaginatum]
MEHKLLSLLLVVGLIAILCASPGQALRLLSGADGGREFSFGSTAAAPGAETEPLDPSLGDEYEISHVEFEPELGTTVPYAVAAAPVPAAAPAGPVRASSLNAPAAEAGSRSMKWWLPPSTMPSFPLFPNPGGMPSIPGLPLPGMPFHPISGWGVPAPPAPPSQPAPPAEAAAAASTSANDPNANGGNN